MEWLPVPSITIEGSHRGLCLDHYCSLSWLNDIKPVTPQTLLIKYDITIGLNRTDSSHQEVADIKVWTDDNQMRLNMKNTFEMVVRGKTRIPLPKTMDGIARS